MRMLDDEYFYEQGKSNTVVWQIEYNINSIGVEAITRTKRVFIKYSATDTYYTPCREVNPATLTYGKDYYATWNKSDPFYYIQDNSIWVFPASTEAVTDWLFIEAIIQPPSLLTSDTADNVQVPERINELIEDGMVSFGLEYLGKPLNEAIAQENLFDKRLRDAMNDLSVRGDGFVQQGSAIQSQFR